MVSENDNVVADAVESEHLPAPGMIGVGVRRIDRRPNKRPFTVDLALTPEDHTTYDALLLDRRTTIQVAFEWVQARGYRLKFGAVYRHRRAFLEEYARDDFWARVAERTANHSRRQGSAVLADGALTTFERMLLMFLMEMEHSEKLTSRGCVELAAALQKMVGARSVIESLRREYKDPKPVEKDSLTREQEATDAGPELVERMRRILNL